MLSLLLMWWLIFLVPGNTLKVSEFYAFGEKQGDTTMDANDDGSSPFISISTKFPFFNNLHDQLIVSTNGAISFLTPVSQYTPDPFPLDGDRRLITPFWGDVDTTKGGHVRYRETTDPDILDKASNEIKTYFPNFYNFPAAWVFIATWDKVAFFGCSDNGCLKRNTFQAVLISNGKHAFAIFNYENIEWTTGTASGGDADTGLGGTPAQAGFNAGDGKIYFAVNGSQTSDIININQKTNVGIPGKFAFRIDTSLVETGGCNTDGRIIISPKGGPMFGGQHITFSGPCIDQYDVFKVKFKGVRGTLTCEKKSRYSFFCITPKFNTAGDVQVHVSLTGKSSISFEGHYTVLNPVFCKVFVIRDNPDNWKNGTQSISWKNNVPELENSSTVDLEVHTLKENSGKLNFERLNIVRNISNSIGSTNFNFNVTQQVALLQVKSRVKRSKMPVPGIWSDVFLVSQSREEARQICEKWLESESSSPVLNASEPCPCTLQQALLDIVKYQPDPDCNMFHMGSRGKGNCRYRRDAQHCVRLPTPSISDNVCCYNAEGNLIDSRLQEGGTRQRYHYSEGVPYVNNFYHDVMPFMQCCRFSQTSTKEASENGDTYSLCQKYLKLRNYSSCQNYEPPRLARTSGDPHMTTLDGFSYTFNGAGEFVYIYTEDELFRSQIRFEQFRKDDGTIVPATVATAVVMEYANSSGRLEFRLNSIRTVDVLRNSELLGFGDSRWMDLEGVTILLLPADGNSSEVSLMVMFKNIKIAFNIKASKKIMNVIPIVHGDEVKGKLKGLLGNYDENPSNDLLSSDDQYLSPNASDVEIYNRFGMSWAINETESMFTYEPGKSFADYHQPLFRPVFESSVSVTEEVRAVCGEDKDCIFDYSVTGSRDVAEQSRTFQTQFQESQQAAVIVITCDDLPTVAGGVWKSTNGNLENSSAIFVCRDGYNVSGRTQNIVCKNGQWEPFGDVSCLRHDYTVTDLQTNSTSTPFTLIPTNITDLRTNSSTSTPFTLIPTNTENTSSNVPVYIGVGGALLCIFIFFVILFLFMMKKRRFGDLNIFSSIRTSNDTQHSQKGGLSTELSTIPEDKPIYPAR
ncbi:protein mesh-like [Saccostrea echinata]|uniref:protein mesh-like n=1 Tax=Saccostrea echinata TaxID=191078 RepID=UPI002A7F16CF|nr:protein mesh-like [Saccostrea echinata]